MYVLGAFQKFTACRLGRKTEKFKKYTFDVNFVNQFNVIITVDWEVSHKYGLGAIQNIMECRLGRKKRKI